MTNKI